MGLVDLKTGTIRDAKGNDIPFSNAVDDNLLSDSKTLMRPLKLVEIFDFGLYDPLTGHFINSETDERMTLAEALDENFLDPHSIVINDPSSEQVFSLEESMNRGLVSGRTSYVVDTSTKEKISLMVALDRGIVIPRPMSIITAVDIGLYNEATGKFYDPTCGLYFALEEAVDNGLIDSQSLIVDPATGNAMAIAVATACGILDSKNGNLINIHTGEVISLKAMVAASVRKKVEMLNKEYNIMEGKQIRDSLSSIEEEETTANVEQVSKRQEKQISGRDSLETTDSNELKTNASLDENLAVIFKKDDSRPSSQITQGHADEITKTMAKDALGDELDMGEMLMVIDQQPGDESLTKNSVDKPSTVPGKEKDLKKPASDQFPSQVDEIPGKMEKEAFGRELDMGDMSIDQHPGDVTLTNIAEDKPVPGKDKSVNELASEESPRQVDNIPGKMNAVAFGKECNIGEMSIDRQTGDESCTRITQEKSVAVSGKENDVNKLASEGSKSPRQVEIPSKMDKDAFGREFDMGEMSVVHQPGGESFTKIGEDMPVTVSEKEQNAEMPASEGSLRNVGKIPSRMDKDGFGKELYMGDMSIDRQCGDESSPKIGEDKPVTVPGQDKDITKPASEGYPRKVDEMTGKINNDAFGREFNMGEMSVDQQPGDESLTKIAEDMPDVVSRIEDTKKLASEGAPRKAKEISGKIVTDAFGKELDMGDMSIDHQSDDDSFTKIGENKPVTVPVKDRDVKRQASEESPRQYDVIPGKMDKDAFGREFNMGKMSVDQQPDDADLTTIAEVRPVSVSVNENDLKKPASEGSPRKVELIPGKMAKDAFGKEFDIGDMSVGHQPSIERFTKSIEDKPVPGKEDDNKPLSEKGTPRKEKEISGEMDKDAFGKELDIGDISNDQQSDDESFKFTKIAEEGPVAVSNLDKNVKKPASEGSPQQIDEIPGKMDKYAFGSEFDMGEMFVSQQPGKENLSKIGEDEPVTIPRKEKDVKKPASEGSSRMEEQIPSKMDKDAFGKELCIGDMSVGQQHGMESSAKNDDRPDSFPGQDKDVKKLSSEGDSKQYDEITGKIDNDALGREFDIRDMSVDQQPGDEGLTKVAENKPDTVHEGDRDAKKPASEEGSPRKVKEITGKMDKDAFRKRIGHG